MSRVNYGRGMAARQGVLLCNGKLDRGITVVARDLIFALCTERGSLPADPERGLGLASLTFVPSDPASLPAIGPDIDAEFLKDARIESSDTTLDVVAGELVIRSIVVLKAGPSFALVGPLADVRVEILAR